MERTPSPRRRFQFRLRTMMIVVTAVAVVYGYKQQAIDGIGDRRRRPESREWSIPPLATAALLPRRHSTPRQNSEPHRAAQG
jgi:hypothetical protein